MVNETLTLHASQGYENAVPAALLWLELNENRPPAAIIRGAELRRVAAPFSR